MAFLNRDRSHVSPGKDHPLSLPYDASQGEMMMSFFFPELLIGGVSAKEIFFGPGLECESHTLSLLLRR